MFTQVNSPLPLIVGLGYTVYRVYNKRKLRNPEGPYLGGTPFFGAVIMGVVSVILGFVISTPVVRYLPYSVKAVLGGSIVGPLVCILAVQSFIVIAMK